MKRLGRIGLFSIVLLGGGSSQYVHAQPAAAETLTGAGLFAFGGIGFAGATSEGEKAFRAVMALPHDAALQTMESVARKIPSGAYDGDVKPVKKS